MHALALVAAGFKVWMVVDAMHRLGRSSCCNNYWLWIIIFVPFGEVAYFFTFKIHDPEFLRIKRRLFTNRVSLDELRYNAEQSPSIHNKVVLAQALCDAEQYVDASRLFAEVLRFDEKHKDVLYGMAFCKIRAGDMAGALEPLEKLISIEPSHKDYDTAMELAEIYWRLDQKEKTLDLLKRIAKQTQRLQPAASLAKYLVRLERKSEAKSLLESTLRDFKHAPKFVQRIDRAAASEAQSLLKSISI